MSEIRVIDDQLTEAAGRIASISGRVDSLRAHAARHSGAAAGTVAAGHVSDLSEHLCAVLPHFAAASGGLADRLQKAAAGYRAADNSIAHAAAGNAAGDSR